MSNWRDRITPEQCDWDFLTEDHYRAAHMAGVRVAGVHDDPMCDADDFEQDALLFMASHKKWTEETQFISALVRRLVQKISQNNNAAETASKAVNRSIEVGEIDSE